jgi:death-on-curing protein
MTGSSAFLTVEQLLLIHQRMIDDFGGDATVRDYALLASAAMMPSAQFGGQFLHDGVPAMAAAYLFHLCKNHPFLDGNKRTALATAEIFLTINGLRLDADDAHIEQLTLGIAEGRISKDEVMEFFREHTTADE